MANVIWKAFKLGDLFQESTEHYLEKSKKHYEINSFKNDDFPVAVCAASKNNNGIVGYIQEVDDVPTKKRKGYLTKGGFGHVFYQQEWFIKPGGSWGMLNILRIKHQTLQQILDTNINGYFFIARILTKIFTSMSSWGYAMPLEREIVLLPVLEVSKNEDHIFDENGKYWTLAIDYISILMTRAKELKEEKTIKLYEAEKNKYEAEQKKYEAKYILEKKNVIWRAFKLDDLFITITGRDSKIAQKNLDKNPVFDEDYNISIVTESTQNNGVGFYMKATDPIIQGKIVNKGITFGTQFGNCNYHDYKHFIIGNTNYLRPKNIQLQDIMNIHIGSYFAILLNNIFKKSGLYGFGNKIDQSSFYREVILLPVLESKEEKDSIWEENGRVLTLAANTVSYLYLQGQTNILQKKIENYSHWY